MCRRKGAASVHPVDGSSSSRASLTLKRQEISHRTCFFRKVLEHLPRFRRPNRRNGGDDWQSATIEGLFSAANQPQYGLSLNLGGDVQSNGPSRSSMLEFQTCPGCTTYHLQLKLTGRSAEMATGISQFRTP